MIRYLAGLIMTLVVVLLALGCTTSASVPEPTANDVHMPEITPELFT